MHPLSSFPQHILCYTSPLSLLLYTKINCSRLLTTCYSTSSQNNVPHQEKEPHSSVPYPFPTHAKPTPHEIFHLKPGASSKEIKSRYFELVRVHHPDTSHSRRLPSHISHARFQAIKSAYDVLTGKVRRTEFRQGHTSPGGSKSRARPEHYASYSHSHNGNAEWMHAAGDAEANADDRWKDRILIWIGAGVIGLAVLPFLSSSAMSDRRHKNAAQNLAQARREAREYGLIRRSEIRKRVRAQELQDEYSSKLQKDGYKPD